MSKLYHSIFLLLTALYSGIGHSRGNAQHSWASTPDSAEVPIITPNSHAVGASIRKSERDARNYQMIHLKNQMRVLLVSDSKAIKSLAALALPIGSLEDPPEQQGLAHYLEHMLLMGSKQYPEADGFSQFLSKHGGHHNASTAAYRTAYYLEVENKFFREAVSRLADAIAAPLLDPIYADKERNAVNAELTMARSSDGFRMMQVDSETLNPEHPYTQFSGGNLETLSDKPGSILQQTLQQFYHTYYSANLMVGVLYGQESLPELTKLAEETFGKIEDRNAAVPEIKAEIATAKERGLILHYVPARPYKQLRFDFHLPNDVSDFGNKVDSYISYLIRNRSENTLVDVLTKQGYIENIAVSSSPIDNRSHSRFRITLAMTDKGLEERDTVISMVFHYLNKIRDEGMDVRYFNEIERALALDFRYLSINRNIAYVENLADMLLLYPEEHVLDADYFVDHFDKAKIANKLARLTPEEARIWYVSAKEPHNKKAYFVEAPYQVQTITPEQFAMWRNIREVSPLQLPELNPYIPTDFSILSEKNSNKEAVQIVELQRGLRALFKPSHFFSEEPKANMVLNFRSSQGSNSPKAQVEASLLNYLAHHHLKQLLYQASIGGIELSLSMNNGIALSAEGFTQHLAKLLQKAAETYQTFEITEAELEQAKAWYLQQLEAQEKGQSYRLVMQTQRDLAQVGYAERDVRRELLADIEQEDIRQRRTLLLSESAPELLIVGNMDEKAVKTLGDSILKTVESKATTWWHGERFLLDTPFEANFQSVASGSDSALGALYIPLSFGEYESMAYSYTLSKILHPWFFNQLRTQEQLGYALFVTNDAIGQNWGLNFLLESGVQAPAYLFKRYELFYQQALDKLEALSETEFLQYQSSIINTLKQRPQTLSEEFARLLRDYNRSNHQFDAPLRLIALLESMTKENLLQFYKESLFGDNRVAIVTQVLGKQENGVENPYMDEAQWHHYESVSDLQKQLKLQQVP